MATIRAQVFLRHTSTHRRISWKNSAHYFRVFFIGHKRSMEAKYTTNKGILPDLLASETRDAFSRSEEFLDLKKDNDHPVEKQKEIQTERLGNLTQEELSLLQSLLEKMNNKTNPSN